MSVWFNESYWPGVMETTFVAAEHAEVALSVGTSALVLPPMAAALYAKHTGAFLIDVNPERTELSEQADAHLAGPAGEVLPALWDVFMARREERRPAGTL